MEAILKQPTKSANTFDFDFIQPHYSKVVLKNEFEK